MLSTIIVAGCFYDAFIIDFSDLKVLNGGEYQGVGAVDYGGVEAGEVDLGCCFGVVAHTFADDTERYSLGFRRRGPAVTRHIERQRYGHTHHRRYLLEIVVDVVCRVPVGAPLI